MRLIDDIAALPLFSGLSLSQQEALTALSRRQFFKKGATVFSRGDGSSGFYMILAGRVKVFQLSTEGKEQILHIFGPGESVGEAAVFSGALFPAYAEAYEDSTLLFIPRDSFIELIRNDPTLSLAMLAVLSKRLRMVTALVESLSLKEVPARLASHLLFLSAEGGAAGRIELDISKGHLASLLGTIPETLSRILTKMTARGLIRSEGSRITILDRAGMEALAAGERKL